MSPAHESLNGVARRYRELTDPRVITAVQVATAWLIAVTCVALIAVLS
jgi:hypothetical protein